MEPHFPLSHFPPSLHWSCFTMPELITVIVILGILAAVAAPKFFDASIFNNQGFHDQVLASLQYAQKEAIAQHGFVCVTFTANSVSLMIGPSTNGCSTPLANPAGGTSTYTVQSTQASFSSYPLGGFSFDCMGIPRTTGSGTCNDTVGVLTADRLVQVQSPTVTVIRVTKETGFVY
jgi:MSHA pilin protein MshC